MIAYEIIINILIFITGTALASFFNAQIYRIEKEIPLRLFFTKPSSCEKCSHNLTVIELIPVLGYLINGGKCKKCGYKIPTIYPLSELALGLVFVLMFQIGIEWYEWILINYLAFVALYDLQYMGVSKFVMNIGLVYSAVYFIASLLGGGSLTSSGLLIAFGLGIAIFLLNLIKKSFGLGDLILLLILSPFYSWQQFALGIWLSVIIGGILGIILLIQDKNWAKKYIPFMPFIFIGFVSSYLLLPYAIDYLAYISSLW